MERLSIFLSFCNLFITLLSVHQIQTTTISDKNALTFKWYNDVIPAKVNITLADKIPHHAKHLAEHSELYRNINGSLILDATNLASEFSDAISWTKSAGFVDTVFYSYQNHHNLIIRPDDIWTAIIVQFSLYVNANAEELRHSFVNFEGKKELKVKFEAPIDQVPIDEFISKIVTLIDQNINPLIYDWISPNFTTTTENDKLTNGVALMATLQKYFDYDLFSILCGIPQATILGSVDDWREIRERVEQLKGYELNGSDVMVKWSTMLGRILDQFVSVKQGNLADDVFWKQAIRVDYKMKDNFCAKVNETYLSGWITAFSAFDNLGRWQGEFNNEPLTSNSVQWLSIRTDKITKGMVQVPIKIYDEYATASEREYTGAIVTGHVGYAVKKDETTLQPLSGWTMMITNKVPQYLQRKQTTTINKENALTFKWYNDVIPAKVNITSADKIPHHAKHLAAHSKLFNSIRASSIINGTDFASEFADAISWTKSSGLVDTVFYSYQNHHNLIIRPDDIWTAIIVQFSLYVNANAEELRHSFVNFEGKKKLEVKFMTPVEQVPIDKFISEIDSLINENINPLTYDWISPNFTTTTENDKLTNGVALMATLQKYFDYDLFSILCGIPQATILGSVDDWREIRERVEQLKGYELNGSDVMVKWSTMLGRILDQFVSVKQGNLADDVFWKQTIRVDYKMKDNICAEVNETYLSGWITAFSAFDNLGRWQGEFNNEPLTSNSAQWLSIRTDKITRGMVQVPITIHEEYAISTARKYNGAIITGHVGYAVKKDETTLQPITGWTMVITDKLP